MQLRTAFVPETQIYNEMRKHCVAVHQMCLPFVFIGCSGMRQGVAVVGACTEKGGSFPLLPSTLWTHPLFSSPCNTCLFLLFLTASQEFLQCHSSPSQTVRQPTAFTATQCINQAFGRCCKTMSPASACLQVCELVPSEILHLSWTSRNLTVHEKLISLSVVYLCPSNEVKREKFHNHSHR